MKEEIKTNPYSGVSFEYNGHTWGMCARDNGVEILVDGKVRTSVFEEPKLTDEALEKEVEKYCKDKGIVYEEDLNMLDFARHFAELSKHTGESAVNSQPKIEPKFKIGDKIRNKKLAVEDTIIDVKKDRYIFRNCALLMKFQDDWELVEEYVNFFNIEETIDEFFGQMQKFGNGKDTFNWRETYLLHTSPELLRNFANHVATRQKQQIRIVVEQYADKGFRCLGEVLEAREDGEERSDEFFWDGYRECAVGICRELEEENKI